MLNLVGGIEIKTIDRGRRDEKVSKLPDCGPHGLTEPP